MTGLLADDVDSRFSISRWIASISGYSHTLLNPLYYASKAAIVSMVKCLGPLKEMSRHQECGGVPRARSRK